MAQTASLKHTPLAANVPTFCTSLRKRREWEILVPILLKETPKWRGMLTRTEVLLDCLEDAEHL